MLRKSTLSLLLIGAAGAVVAWMPADQIVADESGGGVLIDSDGDFLPDCVEWAVMTSSSNPDTDGDQIGDFVEIVQRGQARQFGDDLPTDQEMRLVVTGSAPGSSFPITWLHVLIRLVNPSDTISSFHSSVAFPELAGFQVPVDLLAVPGAILRTRETIGEGQWLHAAIPMAHPSFLLSLMPCSIIAESVLANRTVTSAVHLVGIAETVCSIQPFIDDRFVIQPVAPTFGYGMSGPNQVCMMSLVEAGSAPGGTLYVIQGAACEDANELDCAPGCVSRNGSILTIPSIGF